MNENEVKSYILREAERLNNEKHVIDLAIHGRYDELKNVDVRVNFAVAEYLAGNDIQLTTDEIPEGSCFPIYFWASTLYFTGVFEDDTEIAIRLVDEVGDLGKSIAWKIRQEGDSIAYMDYDDILDDSDAEKYDKKYGTE